MAWDNRTSGHTTAKQRRDTLLRDDYRCQIRGPQCTGEASEVDHKDNRRGPGYNHPENLQAACTTCHKAKTQREARQAREKWRRKPRAHPGLI